MKRVRKNYLPGGEVSQKRQVDLIILIQETDQYERDFNRGARDLEPFGKIWGHLAILRN